MQVYISAATSQHMEQAPYGSQTTHDVIQTSYTRRGVGIGGIERFAVIEPACKRVCVCSRNSKNLNAPNIRILGFMYLRNGLLEIAEEPLSSAYGRVGIPHRKKQRREMRCCPIKRGVQ